ncbi:hypothetical protein MASR2M44_02860 [Bacteroidota bacterium]
MSLNGLRDFAIFSFHIPGELDGLSGLMSLNGLRDFAFFSFHIPGELEGLSGLMSLIGLILKLPQNQAFPSWNGFPG